MSHVAPCYESDTKEFGPQLKSLLEQHGTVLVRMGACSCLVGVRLPLLSGTRPCFCVHGVDIVVHAKEHSSLSHSRATRAPPSLVCFVLFCFCWLDVVVFDITGTRVTTFVLRALICAYVLRLRVSKLVFVLS